jgi:hypothetical protein
VGTGHLGSSVKHRISIELAGPKPKKDMDAYMKEIRAVLRKYGARLTMRDWVIKHDAVRTMKKKRGRVGE